MDNKEILVKTALSPSRLHGLDYALNPYRGCEHACVYCYAPAVIHWNKGKWGELVEAKINLPRILSKELNVKKKGVVGVGTVTDPYQPSEKKYEITRRCLELLKIHDFPVCIQTKSSLVLRDIDLFKEFSNIEVGVTITSLNDRIRERIEPGASSVKERFQALKELSDIGIDTWVFLGPLLPHITEVEPLIDAIADAGPKYVIVDRLRLRNGVWEHISEFIKSYDLQLLPEYEMIFLKSNDYYREVFETIIRKCREKGLKCEINNLYEKEL
ncbi:MAG: radical SAM protein [Candidatus Methanoperedens sp.]|nr:radical SAM protein [Candidatus Methanoperedens sp.]MCE8429384.1 radical SAM protein [Candidatus Methanoperedens sp.]